MKNMPWQDIYPTTAWDKLLEEYKKGQKDSIAKTQKQKIGHFFGRKFTLPRTISTLDQQIRHYHNIEKRSIDNLQRRAGILRMIEATGKMFLDRHKIPLRHATPKQFRTDEQNAAHKAYKSSSFDYSVSKLVRRAKRKSEYIEKLIQHVVNGDRGFTGGKDNLLAYIKSKADDTSDANLVRVKPDVVMERIDPWHRHYEATFNLQSLKFKAVKGESIFAAAFNQWIVDKKHTDLPFFVWLEGHYVCTAIEDQRLMDTLGGGLAYNMPEGHVNYYRSDQVISSHIQLVIAEGGSLWAYHIDDDGNVDVHLYDTQHVMGDRKTLKKEAYVWGRDGSIFVAQHEGGQFHHSSFLSGKKVRCAGMINAKGGKIGRVDNDSGHYKPGTRHLRNFVQFLDMQNVFTSDAIIEDKSTKPDTRIGFKEYLMLDLRTISEMQSEATRPQRIRGDLNRLKSRNTTLRDLVQTRFEAMRAEIGPAPSDDALWTRAYKAVCLDFAEIDGSWKNKANLPPIPRTRAPRPR